MFHHTQGQKGRFTRAIGIALALSVTLSGCSTVTDWFSDDEEIEIRRLDPINAEFSPNINWDRDLGKGVDGYYSRLRPVYAYNKLFAADRHGVVVALEPDTGKVIWEKNFATFNDDGMWSGIARLWESGVSARIGGISASDRMVFIGTENGEVIALDEATGELVWQKNVPGEVLAAPASDSGILVVNTGAGVLYGFDTRSGEQVWRHESDTPPLTLRGISTPIASNGGALLGTPTGKLQVNIIDSGILAWETQVATPSGATELERIVDIDTTPVLFGGTIYTVAYNGTLAAIELRSGRIVWKREYGAYRNLSVEGNRIYVVDNNSHVYALDRRNGVELWSQNGLKGRSLTAAEPDGDNIVVGDNWGFLHWISKENGAIVSRLSLGGDDEDESVYVAPLSVNGNIIAVTRDGVIASISTP
ncbi:outer membrane protein assembly factor BamB [Alteromonas sp. KUL49]|uniref:outer membrane protein assembly factor BamB n=1 Tax=Alteromonas sp. KUL49 TaxID=2480798 RepID=UPI00102EECF6|nr:outer membrane protein assembly factor BamB [Alteromonas sp. KUL49]TAP39813.1 outer membrane protein assembly factor BamB [Alteromonas sp. KUL49]GEA11819.1 outer membrane protein assembly factor BamB [Alteromonas sp. KUL49]